MINVIYEDNHLLIVQKPAGLLSQGDATGDPSLVDEAKRYIKEKYQKPGEAYVGLVHRLDRPVGGLVALAKTSKAAQRLTDQLKSREMKREYLGVAQGTILAPLALHGWLCKNERTGRMDVLGTPAPNAQEARLSAAPLATIAGTTLLHICLDTGRKHQIRAQLAAAGHPLLYDMRYGTGEKGENVALWGAVLRLTHPTRKESMLFFSSPEGRAFAPYGATIAAFFDKRRERG